MQPVIPFNSFEELENSVPIIQKPAYPAGCQQIYTCSFSDFYEISEEKAILNRRYELKREPENKEIYTEKGGDTEKIQEE